MRQGYPDGPRIKLPLAIIGQMFPALFPFDPLAFGLNIAREFGDIAHYRLGPLHVYQLSHPDLARQILVEQAEKFYKPKLIKRAFRPFAGEGLLTSDGALWRQQRKLMQPAFHHRQLAAYSDLMVAQAIRMVESFTDGEVREISREMAQLTMSVVVKSLFGADLPHEIREISHSMLAVLDAANQRMNSVLQIPSWVPTGRNLRERRALAQLDGMLHTLIQTRRASSERRDDLLSVLLAAVDEDSGHSVSNQQLRDEMMTLFLAGHETTANALTWTWYLLSRHPEIETKLLEELDRVLGGRQPELTDCRSCPIPRWSYGRLFACIHQPPVWPASRSRTSPLGGTTCPKLASSLSTPMLYTATNDSLQIRNGTIRIGSLPGGRSAFHVMRICPLAAVRGYALAMASR
jgi:cytochrome P450